MSQTSPSTHTSNFFITLYTDASFHLQIKSGKIAWRGKCSEGSVDGTLNISCSDVTEAEMAAIRHGIEAAIAKFPNLAGFFVNSDNLSCVRAFWTFGNFKVPRTAIEEHQKIVKLLNGRWIRTKHVKAHTGRSDIRSYMNRTVDRMTKVRS